jgi:hypothetical protein
MHIPTFNIPIRRKVRMCHLKYVAKAIDFYVVNIVWREWWVFVLREARNWMSNVALRTVLWMSALFDLFHSSYLSSSLEAVHSQHFDEDRAVRKKCCQREDSCLKLLMAKNACMFSHTSVLGGWRWCQESTTICTVWTDARYYTRCFRGYPEEVPVNTDCGSPDLTHCCRKMLLEINIHSIKITEFVDLLTSWLAHELHHVSVSAIDVYVIYHSFTF